MHDLALSLSKDDIRNLSFPMPILSVSYMKKVLKYIYVCTKLNIYRKRHLTNTLNCFRQDSERLVDRNSKHNIDISMEFTLGVLPEELSHIVSHGMLNFLNKFETINTDRLHICIATLLLNKKVNFHPNSYYKK